MSLYSAAIKMCDNCDRNDVPLAWSRDGNTKICEVCRLKRGDRETGARSERSHDSERLERIIQATRK